MTPSDKKSKPTASLKPATIAEIRARYRPGVRGCGAKAIATALHLPVGTVAHVCDRIREGDGTGEARPRGRKRPLSEAEERHVAARLATHPFATNAELAAMTHDRVRSRTVSDVLARREPPFTRKSATSRDPDELAPMWKAEVRAFLEDPSAAFRGAGECTPMRLPSTRTSSRGTAEPSVEPLSEWSLNTATASSRCTSS